MNALNDALGVAPARTAYFDWAGWTPLIVVALTATVAAAPLPRRVSTACRVSAAYLGGFAALLTVAAIEDITSLSRTFDNLGAGFWAATAGFIVTALAPALARPRVRRDDAEHRMPIQPIARN